MNNKTIRETVLKKVGNRINPYSPNIKYLNESCRTCISNKVTKNDHLNHQPINNHIKVSKSLRLDSNVFNLSILEPTTQSLTTPVQKYLLQVMNSCEEYYPKQQQQKTHDNLQKTYQGIKAWLNHMIEYMEKQDKKLYNQELPLTSFDKLKEYRFQCYSEIDGLLNKLQHNDKQQKEVKLVSSNKIGQSLTTICPSQKQIQREDIYTEQMRLVYIQALAIESLLGRKKKL